MTSDLPEPTASAARLEHFRTKAPRQRIHPIEKGVLWTVGAQLAFLPWALGGMLEWAQWLSSGWRSSLLDSHCLPRNYEEAGPGQAPFRLFTWPKLVRFPIFWLGLALLGYITVQALNPAWVTSPTAKVGG